MLHVIAWVRCPVGAVGLLVAPDRSLSPSQAVLGAGLLNAGVLLLEDSTKVIRGGPSGWLVNAYPSCGEASITRVQGSSGYVDYVAPFERQHGIGVHRPPGVQEDSRGRQAKSAVRRISRHNSLTDLVTFTYEVLPPNMARVSIDFMNFWKRWCRASGRSIPPYVLVPEWGKKTHRLHIHMGVSWWDELKAVEVCDACARDGLREVRRDIPPRGSFCVGELWGLGFVGAPRPNRGGNGLSTYLSKYLAKDLAEASGSFDALSGERVDIEGLPFGGHRYRASIGSKPLPLKLLAPSVSVAYEAAREVAGGGAAPVYEWRADDEERLIFGDAMWLDYLTDWR